MADFDLDVDVAVVGAGIAGVSAGALLADGSSVVVLEQEVRAGHHASGRSASLLNETVGHPVVCALAAMSRDFLQTPPPGFTDQPLLSRRGLLWVGDATASQRLDELADTANCRSRPGAVRRLNSAATMAVVPAMTPEAVAGGGVSEHEAMAIDTDLLLHGYLRLLRARGGRLLAATGLVAAHRRGSAWQIHTTAGVTIRAAHLVNAAGAWGDVVAERAGVEPLGLQPRRRTACIVPVLGVDPRWPMVMDVHGRYYFEPDAGGVLVSPCDSTPSEPCDATADELDVAIALDTLREATTLPARSVRRAWAGLRTFSRDEVPVVGEEPAAPGFWWLVGQGGGGIKTAPALAAIMAAAILGPKFAVAGSNHVTDPVDPALLSPARLR